MQSNNPNPTENIHSENLPGHAPETEAFSLDPPLQEAMAMGSLDTPARYSFFGIDLLSFLALVVASMALGFAPILVRYCETGPSTIAFWRMAFSLPFLSLGWLLLPKKKVTLQAPSLRAYFMLSVAGTAFAMDLIVWNHALTLTTVANATLFVNFAPLFVALISWFGFKKTLPMRMVFGMLLAVVGGMLLVWPNFSNQGETLFGDGLSILAALFYGIYLIAVQEARTYFNTFAMMTLTSFITGITALIASTLLGEHVWTDGLANWQALLAIAVVIQVVGQTSIAYALAALPATLSSVVLLLQPVISALIALFLFDEILIAIQWMGMIIVLLGILTTKIN